MCGLGWRRRRKCGAQWCARRRGRGQLVAGGETVQWVVMARAEYLECARVRSVRRAL